MRIPATILLALVLALLPACGGSFAPQSGALSGNWQLTLVRGWPRPGTTLPVSGFLLQSTKSLTGSFVLPVNFLPGDCAGAAPVTGTLSGQSVTLLINAGGTVVTLTGNIAADQKSMAGSYSGLGGGCFTAPTSGTWSASLVPPLTGNFTGTISNSTYMALVTGVSPPAPIIVSGTITQSPNIGASNASLSGTITATNYPCFRTATLTGTITGQSVNLTVYGLGPQIGYIGQNPVGASGSPAVVADGSGGLSLTGLLINNSGLQLGTSSQGTQSGPCPKLPSGLEQIENDSADVAVTFQ